MTSFIELISSLTGPDSSRAPQEQGDAVSALLGMTLHQGSLSGILSAVDTMLALDPLTAESDPSIMSSGVAALCEDENGKAPMVRIMECIGECR